MKGPIENTLWRTMAHLIAGALVVGLVATCDVLGLGPTGDSNGGTPISDGVPAPTSTGGEGLPNFHITIPSEEGDAEICVWDHARIDGDLVQVRFKGVNLLDEGSTDILLERNEKCWTSRVTRGYFYPIELTAVNEGALPPNTGAIRVEGLSGSGGDFWWEHNQGTGSTASVVVEAN